MEALNNKIPQWQTLAPTINLCEIKPLHKCFYLFTYLEQSPSHGQGQLESNENGRYIGFPITMWI